MATQVSNGIEISVKTTFMENHSFPERSHFMFSYRIYIENKSNVPVKLLRRHWFIFDSNGEYSQVEGEGVVGQQPVIAPGEYYEYESACNLTSDMGKMHGTYLMQRQTDGAAFKVRIPEFHLIVPYRNN